MKRDRVRDALHGFSEHTHRSCETCNPNNVLTESTNDGRGTVLKLLPTARHRRGLPGHGTGEPPGHALQHRLDSNSRTYCTSGGQIHGLRYRDAQEFGQHLPCRYSLLRELQELLRGELALGLDLAEGPNDGLQHLLASAHGSNGVTDGSDHLEYAVGREPVRQELTCRPLQPNEPKRRAPSIHFE